MSEEPDLYTIPAPKIHYIWAISILLTLGTGLVVAIAYLRPREDIINILTRVSAIVAPTLAAVLAYLKAQETHLSVNSRLTAFMKASTRAASAEGKLQGISEEQSRAATTEVPKV